jgi:cation diffusion facilitator family transporter
MVLAIVGTFFLLELGGALAAHSLVLQAEAVHLLADVLALGVSLSAMHLAVRAPTHRFTYGLRRAEPVAAIFSTGLVLSTTAWIVVEAIHSLHGAVPPKAGIMLVLSLMMVGVNGWSAWLLHDVIDLGHRSHSAGAGAGTGAGEGAGAGGVHVGGHGHGHALNLRGARLHLFGDALGAGCALVAALVIRFGGPAAADPVASLIVAAILVAASVRLLADATMVLLEAAPRHLPVDAIRQVILGFPGVVDVWELHVWSLGAGHDAITANVRIRRPDNTFGGRLAARLKQVSGAEYVTVQVEIASEP